MPKRLALCCAIILMASFPSQENPGIEIGYLLRLGLFIQERAYSHGRWVNLERLSGKVVKFGCHGSSSLPSYSGRASKIDCSKKPRAHFLLHRSGGGGGSEFVSLSQQAAAHPISQWTHQFVPLSYRVSGAKVRTLSSKYLK